MTQQTLHYDNGKISNIERTPEGFLRLTGSIAAVGWLEYSNQDGSIRKEYVDEETLFEPEHLYSIGGAPLTYLHEGGFINPQNYKDYAIGSTGTRVMANVPSQTIDIVVIVQDEKAIKAVESGDTTSLSMGYTTELVPNQDGTFRQTKRRCNHNSLVDFGRCPRAKLNLDGWHQKEKVNKNEKNKATFFQNLIIYHSSLNLV